MHHCRLRILDLKSWIQHWGSRIKDPESRILDAGSRILDDGSRIKDPGSDIEDPDIQDTQILYPESSMDSGYGILGEKNRHEHMQTNRTSDNRTSALAESVTPAVNYLSVHLTPNVVYIYIYISIYIYKLYVYVYIYMYTLTHPTFDIADFFASIFATRSSDIHTNTHTFTLS